VLAELAFAVGQGAQDAIKDDPRGRPFVFDPAARDFWLNGHAQAVPKALLKNKWELVREVVTRIASTMGGLAVNFAIADSEGEVVVINLEHATRARDRVQKTEVRCRAAKGAGEGMFCTF
jgi:hypothetical protein